MKKVLLVIFFLVFKVHANEIEYYTTGQDAFTGWDIYQNDFISFGVPNDANSISGYQHKIHDSKGTFTDNLEYFCDPDDIIVINSDFGKQKKYISYLPIKNDFFLSNKKDFFRASFLTQVKLINSLDESRVEIKIEKSFGKDDNFINNKVTIRNQSNSNIDVAWVAQDAAYMSFVDKNQKNVIPSSIIKGSIIDTKFFSEINKGDKIGTKHTKELNIGSYSPVNNPSNCKIYGGVIDEYAFFATHSSNKSTKKQYPYGYADVTRSSYGSLNNLIQYYKTRKFNNGKLKNRLLLYKCTDIKPDEEIVLQYKQIGELTQMNLSENFGLDQ